MDGWRDGLNRLWRDCVTILPRPAKKIATAKNNRPVPALGKKKKKKTSRPVEKKNAPSRLGKKNKTPRPAIVVVFTLKAVPVSTQYFLTSVLVQLTRTPSVVTG